MFQLDKPTRRAEDITFRGQNEASGADECCFS